MTAVESKEIVHRAMTDESFLNRLRTEPDEALSEYDLDDAEREAFRSGDDHRIRDVIGDAKTIGVAVVVWVSKS